MSSDPNQQQQLPQLTQPPVYAESQQIAQYQQNPQYPHFPQNPQYQQQCMHDFKKTGNRDVFDLIACVFCCTFNFCCCPPGKWKKDVLDAVLSKVQLC